MRFSKQLTACLCVVAFVASGARGDEHDISGGSPATALVNGILKGIFLCTSDCGLPPSTPPPFSAALSYSMEEGRRPLYALGEHLAGLPAGQIQGVTQAGTTVTLYCNPGNCTLGSLNRHALISGAPMMVPAGLYKMMTQGASEGAQELAWLALAAMSWSSDWAPLDSNSARALTRLNKNPGAYKKAQVLLRNTLKDEPTELILGAENGAIADAVSEIVVDGVGTAILDGAVLVIDNTPDAIDNPPDAGGTDTDGTGDTDDAGGTDTDGTGDTDDAGGNSSSSSEDEAANTCGPLTFDC